MENHNYLKHNVEVNPIQEVYAFDDDFIDDQSPKVGSIINKFGLEKSTIDRSFGVRMSNKLGSFIGNITKGLTETIF